MDKINGNGKELFTRSIIIILAILMQYITVNSGIKGTLRRFSNLDSVYKDISIQKIKLNDLEQLNEYTFKSLSKDSWFLIEGVEEFIYNVAITIPESNLESFAIQIYYSTGEAFNEIDSVKSRGKIGENIIPINAQGVIKDLRIDITSNINHVIRIESLGINKELEKQMSKIMIVANIVVLSWIYSIYKNRNIKICAYAINIIILYNMNTLFNRLNKNTLPIIWIVGSLIFMSIVIMTNLLLQRYEEKNIW